MSPVLFASSFYQTIANDEYIDELQLKQPEFFRSYLIFSVCVEFNQVLTLKTRISKFCYKKRCLLVSIISA